MKNIYFVILALLFSNVIIAQTQTAEFEDGSKIDYEVISDKFDDMRKVNIYIGGALGLSFFKPDVCYIKANANLFGQTGIDANIFLNSSTKTQKKGLLLKSKSTGYKEYTNYVVSYEYPRKSYVGVHVGYTYVNFSKDAIYPSDLKAHEIALGIGLTRGKNISYVTHAYSPPKNWTRTKQFNVYADVLIYAGRSIYQKDTSETPNILLKDTSPIGFRTYFAGKSGVGKKGDGIGLTYSFGVGMNTLKKVYPIASFGIYIGIGK